MTLLPSYTDIDELSDGLDDEVNPTMQVEELLFVREELPVGYELRVCMSQEHDAPWVELWRLKKEAGYSCLRLMARGDGNVGGLVYQLRELVNQAQGVNREG